MPKTPETTELLTCMNHAHKCLETYITEFMEYAHDANLEMEPGVDLVRLLVSLDIVIKRLTNGDPVSVFRTARINFS